jgi:2,4-dienoyl-CoA reductase-like NADH-dependent reductase (Old Yellow Enzyme family)
MTTADIDDVIAAFAKGARDAHARSVPLGRH